MSTTDWLFLGCCAAVGFGLGWWAFDRWDMNR